jgi:hypothetical protein
MLLWLDLKEEMLKEDVKHFNVLVCLKFYRRIISDLQKLDWLD